MFDMKPFGAVNNSTFAHTRSSKRGCQNENVSLVGGTQTSTDIMYNALFSGIELAQLMVLFWLDVSTHVSLPPNMHCQMEASTSGRDTWLSYWTPVVECSYNFESTQLPVAFSLHAPNTIDASAILPSFQVLLQYWNQLSKDKHTFLSLCVWLEPLHMLTSWHYISFTLPLPAIICINTGSSSCSGLMGQSFFFSSTTLQIVL